jgi:hypothetical protein
VTWIWTRIGPTASSTGRDSRENRPAPKPDGVGRAPGTRSQQPSERAGGRRTGHRSHHGGPPGCNARAGPHAQAVARSDRIRSRALTTSLRVGRGARARSRCYGEGLDEEAANAPRLVGERVGNVQPASEDTARRSDCGHRVARGQAALCTPHPHMRSPKCTQHP